MRAHGSSNFRMCAQTPGKTLAERIQEIVLQWTKSSLLDLRANVCDFGNLFGIAICLGLPIRLPSAVFQIHDYDYDDYDSDYYILRIQNTSFN